MATKRKKSAELWLNTINQTNSLTDQLENDNQMILPNYIELKQRIELLEEEKDKNLKKLKQLEQSINESDCRCAKHLQQLSELRTLVNELEKKLVQKSDQYEQAIKQIEDEKQFYLKQEEKWKVCSDNSLLVYF